MFNRGMSITMFPDRLAELERENSALRRENGLLRDQNIYLFEQHEVWMQERRALLSRLAEFEVKVHDLERGARKNSGNSSRPPSSDHPKPERKPSGPPRPRGGQPGHASTARHEFGPPDRVVELPVTHCDHCGEDLADQPSLPGRYHQQAEWVERPVEVIEYHHEVKICPHCHGKTEADYPDHVLPGMRLGPRLHAMLALFHRWGQTSLEKLAHLFTHDFGVHLPEATIIEALKRVNDALEAPYTALAAAVRASEVVGVDETGWRIEGKDYYAWAFATERLTYLTIAKVRSHLVPEQVLGKDFAGAVVSDFYDVYDRYKGQRCLAHLRRDLKACAEEQDPVCKVFADQALSAIKRAWDMWRDYQRDPRYFGILREASAKLREDFRAFLVALPPTVPEPVRLLRQRFYQYWEQIWYFLDHPNVPPSNNLTERALRPTVTFRKMSGGSRSEWGAELTARMMSVLDTCRKQDKDVRAFLVQALLAHARPGKLSIPSLL